MRLAVQVHDLWLLRFHSLSSVWQRLWPPLCACSLLCSKGCCGLVSLRSACLHCCHTSQAAAARGGGANAGLRRWLAGHCTEGGTAPMRHARCAGARGLGGDAAAARRASGAGVALWRRRQPGDRSAASAAAVRRPAGRRPRGARCTCVMWNVSREGRPVISEAVYSPARVRPGSISAVSAASDAMRAMRDMPLCSHSGISVCKTPMLAFTFGAAAEPAAHQAEAGGDGRGRRASKQARGDRRAAAGAGHAGCPRDAADARRRLRDSGTPPAEAHAGRCAHRRS